MIKQFCPHCLRAVSLPDDAAGKEVTCPECGKSFAAPARYTPAVTADPPVAVSPPAAPAAPAGYVPPLTTPPGGPAPPPGYVPPAVSPPVPGPAQAPPPPAGYGSERGITFSPRVIVWLPAFFLVVAFLLTFFTWVGTSVAETPLFEQGPWRAAAGRVWQNDPLLVLLDNPLFRATYGTEWVGRVRSDWELMLPYLVFLVLAVALAVGDRLVPQLDAARLPKSLKWLPVVWRFRTPLVAGLCVLTLVLLVSQLSAGFGLERALKGAVEEEFADERAKAGNSDSQRKIVQFRVQERLWKYDLRRTPALWLALACHILAVLTVLLRVWLDRRGNKLPPRLVLRY